MVFQYKIINNLSEGESNRDPIIGVLIAMMGLATAIGNYYLLKRIFKEGKSHPTGKPSQTRNDPSLFLSFDCQSTSQTINRRVVKVKILC